MCTYDLFIFFCYMYMVKGISIRVDNTRFSFSFIEYGIWLAKNANYKANTRDC